MTLLVVKPQELDMAEVVVNILNEEGTPKTPEELEAERASITARGDTPVIPGSQTDSALLLASLQDERTKRRLLEDRIALLEQSPTSSSIVTDEGKVLETKIKDQDVKISTLTAELAMKDILADYPILKEKLQDFEKFRTDPENKGMALKTSAKAFLIENGLLDGRRPGLEKPTGGPRVPTSTGMSVEEIANLRENNFKKYQELLEKGLIKI